MKITVSHNMDEFKRKLKALMSKYQGEVNHALRDRGDKSDEVVAAELRRIAARYRVTIPAQTMARLLRVGKA